MIMIVVVIEIFLKKIVGGWYFADFFVANALCAMASFNHKE